MDWGSYTRRDDKKALDDTIAAGLADGVLSEKELESIDEAWRWCSVGEQREALDWLRTKGGSHRALAEALDRSGGWSWSPTRMSDYVARGGAEELAGDRARPEESGVRARLPAGAPRDVEDPEIDEEQRGKAKYRRASGQVAVDGVEATDPVQGQLADCYFIASLSSIAATRPKWIENAIRDLGDGSFEVRFFVAGRPRYVTVDLDLPERYGSPIYGRSADAKELWPQILEKAWAKLEGGYGAIEWRKGRDPFAALGGCETERSEVRGLSADELYRRMKASLDRKLPVTAGTPGAFKDVAADGVASAHAYSVLGVEEKDGQRYVLLRNPWGSSEFSTDRYEVEVDLDGDGAIDRRGDGIFRMTIEDFRRRFSSVERAVGAGRERGW